MQTAAFWICLIWIMAYVIKYPSLLVLLLTRRYDNRNPRDQQLKLQGWHKKLTATHYNALEGFPGFAAAMILGAASGVPESTLAAVGAFYAACRIVFAVCYIRDWHVARTTIWILSWASVVGLFGKVAFSL